MAINFKKLTPDEMVIHGVVIETTELNKKIKVNEKNLDDLRKNGIDFSAGRLVIDFDVIDEAHPDKPLDNKIKMRVYYTHKDHDDFPNIKLGKLNWKTQIWNAFKDDKGNPISPKIIKNNPIWKGFFSVEFMTLGDPPIALGT